MRWYRIAVLVSSLSLVLAVALPGNAEDSTVVQERQEGFKTMGRAFKAVAAMAKQGATDNPRIVEAAEAISNRSQLISGWFPEGTGIDDGADTDALNYIWKNSDKFQRLTKDIEVQTSALLSAARSGDANLIASAIKSTKDACSACHKSFRAD